MKVPWINSERQVQHIKRHNWDLYNSHKWRKLRGSYIAQLTAKQLEEIPSLKIDDRLKIVLLNAIPVCEICYRLLLDGAYESVKTGTVGDHILCVNPDGWRDTLDGYYGQGMDIQNLQLICAEHHRRKTARDRSYQMKRGGV